MARELLAVLAVLLLQAVAVDARPGTVARAALQNEDAAAGRAVRVRLNIPHEAPSHTAKVMLEEVQRQQQEQRQLSRRNGAATHTVAKNTLAETSNSTPEAFNSSSNETTTRRHDTPTLPIDIRVAGAQIVINGTCVQSCRPGKAIHFNSWTWNANLPGGVVATIVTKSMHPNLLRDIMWTDPSHPAKPAPSTTTTTTTTSTTNTSTNTTNATNTTNSTPCNSSSSSTTTTTNSTPCNSSSSTTTTTSILPAAQLALIPSSPAQVQLLKDCRFSGTAIAHIIITSSHTHSDLTPVHFFAKIVCDAKLPPGCNKSLHAACDNHTRAVVCEPGFYGPDCNQSRMDECPHRCNGRGADCTAAGKCVCKEGFGGAWCETLVGCKHLSYCSGHGQCVDDQVCGCDSGWSGRTCDFESAADATCSVYNHCKGHGRCSRQDHGYACVCDAGFRGPDCGKVESTTACPAGCSGHGVCVGTSCVCDAGFDGPDCSRVSAPCQGCIRGDCVYVADAASAAGGQHVCVCDETWSGPHCDVYDRTKDPCASSSFCSGQGKCEGQDGDCACAGGFGGLNCDLVVEKGCVKGCSGNGTCDVMTDRCVCNLGYSGPDCATPNCVVSPTNGRMCSGHGLCRKNSTSAAENSTSAAGHACVCAKPYFGSTCQNRPCDNSTCNGDGTGGSGNGGGYAQGWCRRAVGPAADLCLCAEGWEGETCSDPVQTANLTARASAATRFMALAASSAAPMHREMAINDQEVDDGWDRD